MDTFLNLLGITEENVGKESVEEFKKFLYSWKTNWVGYITILFGLFVFFGGLMFLAGLLGD